MLGLSTLDSDTETWKVDVDGLRNDDINNMTSAESQKLAEDIVELKKRGNVLLKRAGRPFGDKALKESLRKRLDQLDGKHRAIREMWIAQFNGISGE